MDMNKLTQKSHSENTYMSEYMEKYAVSRLIRPRCGDGGIETAVQARVSQPHRLVVLFKPLLLSEITKIVDLLIVDLRNRLSDRQIGLTLTEDAKGFIARKGFDPVFGARPLKRFLQHELETRIGRALISGDISDGVQIEVEVVGDELVVEGAGGGE